MHALGKLLSAVFKMLRGLPSAGEHGAARKDLKWARKLDDRTLEDIGMTRDQLERLIRFGENDGQP